MPFTRAETRFGSQCQLTECTNASRLPKTLKSGASGSSPANLDLIEVSEFQTTKDNQHHCASASIASLTDARKIHKR